MALMWGRGWDRMGRGGAGWSRLKWREVERDRDGNTVGWGGVGWCEPSGGRGRMDLEGYDGMQCSAMRWDGIGLDGIGLDGIGLDEIRCRLGDAPLMGW